MNQRIRLARLEAAAGLGADDATVRQALDVEMAWLEARPGGFPRVQAPADPTEFEAALGRALAPMSKAQIAALSENTIEAHLPVLMAGIRRGSAARPMMTAVPFSNHHCVG